MERSTGKRNFQLYLWHLMVLHAAVIVMTEIISCVVSDSNCNMESEGQRKKRRLKKTWKKHVWEEWTNGGLSRESVVCCSRWIF